MEQALCVPLFTCMNYKGNLVLGWERGKKT